MNDDTEIVMTHECKMGLAADLARLDKIRDMINALPDDEPRSSVYDFGGQGTPFIKEEWDLSVPNQARYIGTKELIWNEPLTKAIRQEAHRRQIES